MQHRSVLSIYMYCIIVYCRCLLSHVFVRVEQGDFILENMGMFCVLCLGFEVRCTLIGDIDWTKKSAQFSGKVEGWYMDNYRFLTTRTKYMYTYQVHVYSMSKRRSHGLGVRVL